MRTPLLFPALALLLAGCSGDVGLTTSGGDTSGDFAGEDGAVGLATSDYVVLDIASGELTARASRPDLSAATWRQDRILFRRVGGDLLIAVFEVTQAQWQALGGGTPWTTISTAVVGTGATGAGMPAFALSHDEIAATLAAYRSGSGVTLDLPTGGEWIRACDAGGSRYHWGNSQDRQVVQDYALTHDTADGALGPQVVGSADANALGLHDVHGNVCELTDGGDALRGGSWYEPTWVGRASNAVTTLDAGLSDSSEHALVGARLVLRP